MSSEYSELGHENHVLGPERRGQGLEVENRLSTPESDPLPAPCHLDCWTAGLLDHYVSGRLEEATLNACVVLHSNIPLFVFIPKRTLYCLRFFEVYISQHRTFHVLLCRAH